MESWLWFKIVVLRSPLFWWAVLVVVLGWGVPALRRRLRTAAAKRRFLDRQGAQLENPQNADARFQLAHIYEEGRRWRKVVQHAGEAVRIARGHPLYGDGVPYHFLLLWGHGLYHRGRYEEAAGAYSEAVAATSHAGHADARLGLGKARHRLGEAAAALEACRASLQENGSNLEAYFRTAQAAAAAGKPDEAAKVGEEFWRVAATLPRFARRGRLRWRLAFLLFPLTRHLA